MKKVIAWLLVLALTAAVSIGATLAYLTDTDEDVNVMTIGKVKIDQLEYERINDETKDGDAKVQEFHDNKPLYPGVYETGFDFGTEDNYVNWGQIGKEDYTSGIWNPDKINNEVDKMVFVKNKGDYDAYVRTVFAFEAGNYTTLAEFQKMVHLNLNDSDWTWEWAETPVVIPNADGTATTNYFVAVATYNKVLTPDALTEISLSQIALDKTATNADVEAFGETYQVLVKTQAIQADGFSDPDTALTEGFGEVITNVGTQEDPELTIDSENVPFENDNPIEGTDLWTALHYLDGDKNGTQITTAVNSVTFGLNRDYTDIVDNYDGTLVDVEQDVPVYAYYVPSTSTYARAASSNYDVYFLANDDIYTPVKSSELFRDMTALTTVDTSNMNTSRTENFNSFMRGCTKLSKVIEIEKWDVSKALDMARIFQSCSALKELDLSGWNPENATTVNRMFTGCTGMTTLDLSGWNMANATNATQMFANCSKLKTVDTTGWESNSLQNASYMFYGCSALKELIGVEDWETTNVTNMTCMFNACKVLDNLDLSNWNPVNVVDMSHMFRDCHALCNIGTSTWRLNNVTTTESMFSDCKSLQELDADNWGMPKNTNMRWMFARCENLVTVHSENWTIDAMCNMERSFQMCSKLQSVDTGNWKTGNVTNMNGTFNECNALENVDVSEWDTGSCTSFRAMFEHCYKIVWDENTFVKWDTSNVIEINHMFYGNLGLTKLNLSTWNVEKVKSTSHMFTDCNNLEAVDLTGWNTPSLTSMDGMFNDCWNLQSVDLSSFTTDNVLEFSQMFESCSSLTGVKGMNNWNTSNGKNFGNMFVGCSSIMEIDFSSFDTRNATHDYTMQNGGSCEGMQNILKGCTGLTKLTLGKNFSFDGNGELSSDCYAVIPTPSSVEGWDGYWYDADGNPYAPSDIHEEIARTYYAVNPANP